MSTPITTLNLSTRAQNCLIAEGILTVEQAIQYINKKGRNGLLRIPNMGAKRADEVLGATSDMRKTTTGKDVVIFDLDGTLALTAHRQHLVSMGNGSKVTVEGEQAICRGPNPHIPGDYWIEFDETGKWSYATSNITFKPDWPAFFAECVNDEPNHPVIAALIAHRAAGQTVMVVSGRSDEVREQTEAWLNQHIPDAPKPIMRRAGDYTPDHMLKRQWLGDGTIPHERVLCAYDDRDSVVQMWRNAGIPCFQVAIGDF